MLMSVKKKQQEPTTKKKPKEEHLTEREWRELRGEFMPTYKRHKGALRQK
jgi:hypothetical protein